MIKLKNLAYLIITLLALCNIELNAQTVGSWNTYFSYTNVSRVVNSDDEIFALSNGFLFSLDKEYESIQTYSKLNGLSDGLILDFAYSEKQKALIIVYDNCNIDIFEGGTSYNISDLKRKNISDKRINNIITHDDKAYLACGFGIVVINLKKKEIADTYILGNEGNYTNVSSLTFYEDKIFAATADGIKYANVNSNLADYANWSNLELPQKEYELPKSIIAFNDHLYSTNNSSVYAYDLKNKQWQSIIESTYFRTAYDWGDGIGFISDIFLNYYTGNKDEAIKIKASKFVNAAYDKKNKTFWIATANDGGAVTLKKTDFEGNILNEYKPNGPYSNSIARLKIENHKLIAASGGPFDLAYATPGRIQTCEDGTWRQLTVKDLPQDPIYRFTDILDASFDPKDNKRIYAAGWDGLYEFYDYQFVERYNSTNSTVENVDIHNSLLDGLLFDKENNLYMTNMQCANSIQVKKNDNSWCALYYPEITNKATIRRLFRDKKGRLWLLFPRMGVGVFIIDDNNTPFNSKDDITKLYSSFTENSSDGVKELTPSTIRCIAEDKNGAIWIGTDIGPLIFPENANVLDKTCYVDRIKITRTDNENFADYLLANEQVNAIMVDGANRKWIGTASSGIYLISEDGQETIQHFTVDNSPLTSNTIMDIAIDEQTGIVYMAASNGLFSYMSDAMEGSESYSDVHIYPNPVKESYNGQIVIKGLMENSIIRIADTEGNVVCSGKSNGGIFTWDGRRRNGTKVNSGIYFVLMALEDGSEKSVAKIAFIN